MTIYEACDNGNIMSSSLTALIFAYCWKQRRYELKEFSRADKVLFGGFATIKPFRNAKTIETHI